MSLIGTCSRFVRVSLVLLCAAAFLPSSAGAEDDCIVLESFAKSTVGQFPAEWKVRKDVAKKDFTVQTGEGFRYLRASSKGLGVQAARQNEWNLNEYPILSWRWRPVEFPKGSDERTSRNDSVLSVYFLVPYSSVRGPRALKYIWSEQVPTGTRLESNMGLTKVRVLRSGRSGVNTWTEERVDARADFLAAFALSEAPAPGGIGVLTDSDDTSSTATGDYAEFRACRK